MSWVPKLGQKFDYDSSYLLAEEVCNTFSFENAFVMHNHAVQQTLRDEAALR